MRTSAWRLTTVSCAPASAAKGQRSLNAIWNEQEEQEVQRKRIRGQSCEFGFSKPLWGLKRLRLKREATSYEGAVDSPVGPRRQVLQVPQSASSGLGQRGTEMYRAFFLFSCREVTIGSIALTISVYVGGLETDQLLCSAHRRTSDGSHRFRSLAFLRERLNFAKVLYIWLIVKGTKSASQSMRALPSVILKIGHGAQSIFRILEHPRGALLRSSAQE